VKLLVVDDHAIFRQGVAALLARAFPNAEVLEAPDSAAGLAAAEACADLDAVFLDLAMPGMDGLAALKAFGRARPGLPVIVLTAADDPELARQAFAAGALGYVPKSATSETLLAALRLVLQGEIFVPSLMVREARPHGPGRAGGAPPLTIRQLEVLEGLDAGLSNKAIANRLGLTEKTVKGHVTGVLRALGAADRGEAVRAARAAGLIPRG